MKIMTPPATLWSASWRRYLLESIPYVIHQNTPVVGINPAGLAFGNIAKEVIRDAFDDSGPSLWF
jgi:hypothetical protein